MNAEALVPGNSTVLAPSFSRCAECAIETRIDIPASKELEHDLIVLAALHGKPRAAMARELLSKAVAGEMSWLRSIGKLPARGDGKKDPE